MDTRPAKRLKSPVHSCFPSFVNSKTFFSFSPTGFILCLTSFFELLKERVDEARADFFSHSLFEAVDDAVAVGGSFIKNHEYVKAREIGQKFIQRFCF